MDLRAPSAIDSVPERFNKNGRELQKLLGSTQTHTSWGKMQVIRLNLKLDTDYKIGREAVRGGRRQTYQFTEDAASKIVLNSRVNSEEAFEMKNAIEPNPSPIAAPAAIDSVPDRFNKNGRELQEFLGSTKDHTSWAKLQISILALEGVNDYKVEISGTRGRKRHTYFFTEIAANRIAAHSQVKSETVGMINDNSAIGSLEWQVETGLHPCFMYPMFLAG